MKFLKAFWVAVAVAVICPNITSCGSDNDDEILNSNTQSGQGSQSDQTSGGGQDSQGGESGSLSGDETGNTETTICACGCTCGTPCNCNILGACCDVCDCEKEVTDDEYGANDDSGENSEAYITDMDVTITTAGTLSSLLGNQVKNIVTLKITGPLNGDDIICLREMMGGEFEKVSAHGSLSILDLSDASIVEGGSNYYMLYHTSNNEIGDYMFNNSRNLEKIILPNNVTAIGYNGLGYCYSLTDVTIPYGVTRIGGDAFAQCRLTEIDLPSSIRQIDDWAFCYCYALKDITIPSGVTSLESSTFYNCESLENVSLPNSLTEIGSSTFTNCYALKNITIPSGVTSLGSNAFYNCESLENVSLSNSLTEIGSSTFRGCIALKDITIPSGVTSIGSTAFSGCTSLLEINVKCSTPPSLSSNAFDDSHYANSTLYVPTNCKETYSSTNYWKNFSNIAEKSF